MQILALVALLYVAPAASALEVCIDDKAELAQPARAALHREFEFLLTRERVRLRWGSCEAQVIRLTIEGRRDGVPANVLGVALRRGDVILPYLAVFVEPVIEYTRAGGWNSVGRALARVAAHEVRHFLEQRANHAPHGLMQAAFHPRTLSDADSRPFLR